ncbi:MAG: aldo/keto reductase [Actinomycetota bacterium]|nr:aldo/keto reductase [Actinomycetota bacterium]
MRYIEVNGVRLSVIGLGTWQFGSKDWGYGADYAQNEAGPIVTRALDLGVNLVDTAEIYGRNESERIVGRAIASRRDEVFVATKLLPIMPLASVVERHGRASAKRLGIDVIDLYQIHFPNPAVPIAEQMRGMRRLVDAGVVAHVGVSNFPLAKWRAAERALGSPVLSNQVQYSLAVRKPDAELVPYAAASDRLVIAYSPLAKGLLSGRYDATNLPKGAARENDPLFLPENVVAAHDLIETLRTVAKNHDATPSQVALAWVISHPNVVAIPGASSLSQLESNVAAADLQLSGDEIAELTAASDAFHPVRGPAAAVKVVKRRIRR